MIFGLSFTKIASVFFLAYMFNNFWQLYKLFTPDLCAENLKNEELLRNCYLPSHPPNSDGKFEKLQLRVYISQKNDYLGELAMKFEDLQISEERRKSINITIPKSVSSNGFLYAHVILLPQNYEGTNPMTAPWKVHAGSQMIVFQEPVAKTFNLLETEKNVENEKKSKRKTVTISAHFRSVLPIRIATDSTNFLMEKATPELRDFLTIREIEKRHEYLPMLFIDEMSMRSRDLVEIENGNIEKMNLTIDYQPTSVAKLLLLTTSARTVYQLTKHGFKDKDIDELRGLFTETSLLLLMLTFFVSTLHLLFDALAFKNDISFWRGRDSMVGLSSKTLLWRCFSQTIIFFYLHDQKTSLLVLIPAGISTIIEYWKITIAYKIRISFQNGISFGKHSKEETETESIDSEAMKYLSIILAPLIICGSVYSLMYIPQTSWKSWILQMLSNGVYAFGFLFMLPQLFVNYKLKSVAHLPWRAFMYKAFNTFIDDLFAFIITMPTAHRMACFRDDIVFVIYLYQRWLYPVDYSRPNEYGEIKKEEEEKLKKEN